MTTTAKKAFCTVKLLLHFGFFDLQLGDASLDNFDLLRVRHIYEHQICV